jgi:hypothetical protein
MFGGAPPVPWRRRPEPLGMRAVGGRLVDDEAGEPNSDSEDTLGGSPGRAGWRPGPESGYGRRGAGEYDSRRGGGVPEGEGWAERRSRPHIIAGGCSEEEGYRDTVPCCGAARNCCEE